MAGKMFKKLSLFAFLLLVAGTIFILIFLDQLPAEKTLTGQPVPGYTLDYAQIEKFRIELKNTDPKIVYRQIKDNTKNLPFTTKHDIAHLFGKALYKAIGNSAVSVCDNDLSYGCYHGLFMEAINAEGTSVIKNLDNACAKAGKNLYTGCQHGIGHGLVEYFGRNKIPEALDQCKIIQKNLLVGCSSGVFMEYFFPSSLTQDPSSILTIDRTNPFQVCKSLDPKFINSCFYELPRLWKRTEPSFDKLTERCLNLGNKLHQKSCFRGLGYAIGDSANPDPKLSLSICKNMPDEQQRLYCLSGATWFFGSIDQSEIAANAVRDLCKNSYNEVECKKLSDLHLDQI